MRLLVGVVVLTPFYRIDKLMFAFHSLKFYYLVLFGLGSRAGCWLLEVAAMDRAGSLC